MPDQLSLMLPEVPENEVFYVLEERKKPAMPSSYADIYAKQQETLTRWEGQNWSHPQVMDSAFRIFYNKETLAQRIRELQKLEGRYFSTVKLDDYAVVTIPAQSYRLFDLENTGEALRRTMTINPDIPRHIRDDFATLFTGRTYGDHGPIYVGNELTLNQLAAIAGEDAARAIAGPDWKSIGDTTYMKLADRHTREIKKLIADNLPEDRLAAAVEWLEGQRYSILYGMVMNHWQAFADDHDGFLLRGANGQTYPFIVIDTYAKNMGRITPLTDFAREWTDNGTLQALLPLERQDDFMRSFGETFARLSHDKMESYARQEASHIWIVPGGFEDRTPQTSLQHRPIPRLQ